MSLVPSSSSTGSLGGVRVVGVEAENVVGDPLRLGRGVKDFAALLFQNLNPGLKVTRVIGNVARKSKY